LIILLSLVLRLSYAIVASRVDPFLQENPLLGDASAYDRIARNLLVGEGFSEWPDEPTAFWPPLYPILLSVLYKVFGYHFWIVRLFQAILGVIAVAATMLAASELFDRRVAYLTGLGMALYPHLIYFSAWLIAEALYMTLLSLVLLLAVRLQKGPQRLGFVGLGLLLGLATLTKPATLMLLPFIGLWILIALPLQLSFARRLGYLTLTSLFVLLSILPWTVRNYLVFDEFVPVSTNGGYTFYGANNSDAFGGHREGFPSPLLGLSEVEAERVYYRNGLTWIVHNPADFGQLAIRKVSRLLSPLSVASFPQDYALPFAGLVKGIYAAFLLLAVVGFLASLVRWRDCFILYVLIVRVFLGALIFYGDARYTLPMVPALVILVSFALVSLQDRFRSSAMRWSPVSWMLS
jgi:4-amino-4-deoxy-L-arabinose transferase-like glycosyltransferase